ncbi:thioesterase family protein [Neptunomonas marina]|nr:thioesterase family protein [Neptunomonas marina]
MLLTHYEPIPSSFCDYNGHLNEGYYLVMLTTATDTILDHAGLDATSRDKHQFSAFTVQNTLRYFREVKQGQQVVAHSRLLSSDNKRLRLWHEMRDPNDNTLMATMESVMLAVNMESRRCEAWPTEIAEQVYALQEAHNTLSWPDGAGVSITAPAEGCMPKLTTLASA